MKELRTDFRTYLVKFAWTSQSGQFITQDLPATIEQHDPDRGIEYIKEFDPYKARFKRISKADILDLHQKDDNLKVLTSHSYFSK